MKQETMLERLAALGCDVVGAMNRMMQDESFYRECLTSFADDPLFPSLGDALRGGNTRAAFEHAHALKGVSANLGLTPLWEQAGALVEQLRTGSLEGTDELYQGLLLQLVHLRECL